MVEVKINISQNNGHEEIEFVGVVPLDLKYVICHLFLTCPLDMLIFHYVWSVNILLPRLSRYL